jgi:hypothetical protein
MKKIFVSLLLFALFLSAFGQNQDEFKFSLVPRRVSVPSVTGFINQNGTVPLTADWNVGAFKITAKVIAVPNGTVTNPSIVFYEDATDTGLFFEAPFFKLIRVGLPVFTASAAGIFFPGYVMATDGYFTNKQITAGAGTGLTVDTAGALNRQVYKVTVDYTGFSAAATHAHHVIATLPAKTRIVGIIADTTAAYSGGAVSACTLEVGKTTDTGIEYILLHDVKTTAVVKGLVDGDLGESLIHDHAVQGGDLPSWTTTTDITATIRTTDANTSALGAGSTTFYITTERF